MGFDSATSGTSRSAGIPCIAAPRSGGGVADGAAPAERTDSLEEARRSLSFCLDMENIFSRLPFCWPDAARLAEARRATRSLWLASGPTTSTKRL